MASDDEDPNEAKSESTSDESEPYRVGPGKPPLEHRWKKGCRSPNPAGRPPKRRISTMLQVIDPLAARVLEHGTARIPLRKYGSKGIVRVDANLDALFKQGLTGSTRASLAYHEIQQEASAKRRTMVSEVMRVAVEHQEKWLDAFIEAEMLGRPLPKVFPDPRDIVFSGDGIRIIGPVNRADKDRDDRMLVSREAVIEDLIELEVSDLPADAKAEKSAKLKELYAIFNDNLSFKHQRTVDEMLQVARKTFVPVGPVRRQGPVAESEKDPK